MEKAIQIVINKIFAISLAISWLPPWILHLFLQWSFSESHTFLQLGCFGLDLMQQKNL